MYAVVGCTHCNNLKIVDGDPKTTKCPRCRKTLQFRKLKKFVETDDVDHAREVRASMLANRQGYGEQFAEMDSFAAMDRDADEAVVSDDEYLEGSGLDATEVDDTGARAMETGSSLNRKDAVLAALREQDAPSEAEVVAFAAEHGVPAEYAKKALSKLVRAGEVSESRGEYRLL